MTIKVKLPVDSMIDLGNKTPEEIEAAKIEAAKVTAEAEKAAAEKAAAEKAAEEKAIAEKIAEEARLKAKENKDKLKVLIDDKEYLLDENGNAISQDGSIFMTKENLDALEEIKDDKGILSIEELEKLSGIQIIGEDGKKIIYDNTIESLAKREADIRANGIKEGQSKAIETFFQNNKDIYAMAVYKQKHGTLEGFKEKTNYSKIELSDKDSEDKLSQIIIEAELRRGNTIDRAKKILSYIKADGKLYEEAVESKKFLELKDKEEDELEAKRIDAEEQAEIEKVETYYGFRIDENGRIIPLNVEGSVYDMIINKGIIGDIIIPTDGIKFKTSDNTIKHVTKQDILNYVSVVVKDGLSQAQIDERNRLSSKSKLLGQYIYNLTGGDISSLITSKMKNENVNVYKARLKTVKLSGGKNDANVKQINLPVS